MNLAGPPWYNRPSSAETIGLAWFVMMVQQSKRCYIALCEEAELDGLNSVAGSISTRPAAPWPIHLHEIHMFVSRQNHKIPGTLRTSKIDFRLKPLVFSSPDHRSSSDSWDSLSCAISESLVSWDTLGEIDIVSINSFDTQKYIPFLKW
ncbi:hypothetical protein M413DRAFT_31559 [Hebeloma cylindrosporum]|uniref:Uncharacterized protein n=1 Tax=Hebeloma cylindrosporum TaxID=76867 RepID=A0A0C3BIG0_HEBCY|nr:hypothetical protein M413DRAFT_31559 [Hebeloma cylindrosporum h7]